MKGSLHQLLSKTFSVGLWLPNKLDKLEPLDVLPIHRCNLDVVLDDSSDDSKDKLFY